MVSVTSCQEMDANKVWVRRVDCLEYLFEGVLGVLLAKRAADNEVRQPKGVEGRELLDLIRFSEPVLPVIEVFIVDHTAHSLKSNKTAS